MHELKRKDIIYPELSFQTVCVLFEVSNSLGAQYHERYYQRAIASLLREAGIEFREQVRIDCVVNGQKVAQGVVDFLIEGKLILEIKKGERFIKQNIDQLNSYLLMSGIQLGILANFTSRGLQFKRIINIRNSP